ncbi:MAG: TetR/AcrR family transcriptional regulator [Parvibaculaceae bacterium]|nr:TetR/AcrR family transcriptional regulator [Parvibaculaceae bacterium]
MGRKQEFDPVDATSKAMHLFWAKGYYDTSIRDLVAATGVNYYGLYNVFDDKRGLFLAALDRYRATVTTQILASLTETTSPLTGIQNAFDRAYDLMKPTRGHAGCFMCNTAIELAPHDTEAAQKVQAHLKQLKLGFQAALERAQEAGELSGNADPKSLGEYLATTAYSLGMLVRAGMSPAYVKRHAQNALSILT